MGKRKHEDKEWRIRKKIRRLQKRLNHLSGTSDDSDPGVLSPDHPRALSPDEQVHLDLSESDDMDAPTQSIRSVVAPGFSLENANRASLSNEDMEYETQVRVPTVSPEPVPSTSKEPVGANNNQESLPQEILEALGDSKGKDEVFGPPIPDEIAKRWGCILVDGLTKEQKQEVWEKSLVPENFKLAKAPLLNPEIIPVLSEPIKNRDKLLEKAQNHLGRGIAGLTNLTCSIIDGDTDKIQLLKKISDINKILLDLHYENTKTRRKLVITSLDKKFTQLITDVKRDTYLFGANLGEKIKASKTAERSGLQIKRSDHAPTSRKFPQQGNWRGPPRSQGQQARRQGGQRPRFQVQTNKRPTSATHRQTQPSKTNYRANKP
ncbi:uncharacterized protein LOC124635322 [Helicoverpa zea]|uniref:uncharacterized protein LOC124631443 n=1 Tax=Helicoverpa zea TaxID=7113 RepID=UPI001F571542|nr:uncharacterized protein LOC124631443 [Helicoverpa zea]XP_047027156.1 uncharacterized protein LOC124635322 [Helicoverpa zea]